MSIAYVAGFIVGVLMVALVGFLVNKLATGKFGMKKCEFDEQIHENTPLFIAFCAYFLKLSTGELRVRTGNLSR